MKKKLFAIFTALLMVLAVSAPSVLAASVPTKSLPTKSKSAPTEKAKAAESIFDGYTVTVTDTKTSAKMALGTDWPITTLYFFDANGNSLGSISGTAYHEIMNKYKTATSWEAPGADGQWEFWFAEEFNSYRGLSGSTGGKQEKSKLDGGFANEVDTSAFADEVVILTNKERENAEIPPLEIKSEMMELAQIRAEEIADQFSHVRPNGVRISELGYGENISKGRESPVAALNGWMNSSGHKTNILNEKYDEIGAGCFLKNGTYYWVQLFSGKAYDGKNSDDVSSKNSLAANKSSYNLNATELSLTAGETYQLVVENADNAQVEWSVSRLGDGILSVDDTGCLTAHYRSGMSSAKATLNVFAKIYVSDKLVKTLNCKVIVTQ